MCQQSTEPSDQHLIAACRRGDAAAWESLCQRFGNLVYSIGKGVGLSDADAAEVTQQTFCILHDSLDRLRADSKLGPWLGTVAKRHSWRVLARRKRESPEAPEELSERINDMQEPDHPTATWERLEWLHHGLSLLDQRCRELLTALYLLPSPQSYQEIARRLKIPAGSIGPTRGRCLEKMRAALESA